MVYKAKRGQVSYGEAIGIILLDTHAPFIPGDVGNASTYPFPVRYRTIKNFTAERMFNRDTSALELFLEAGEELVREGVKAITGDCGYMALFQQELANHLDVPVFMSSLLQVPLLSRMLRQDEKVGIICANSKAMDESLLQAVGIDRSTPLCIRGLEEQEHFNKAAIEETGILNSIEIEKEVVSVAKQMVEEDPKVKTILLECSMLPPYAAAVQRAVQLPVFDYTTMINFVYSSLVRKRFEGFM